MTNYATALQPDGKILVGGSFNVAGAAMASGIARFNADGTIDATFNADFNDAPNITRTIYAIELQSDGKIIIGGNVFVPNTAESQAFVARLNPNGTRDSTFNFFSNNQPGGIIYDLRVYPDNRVLIGGSFTITTGIGISRSNVARLNANGSLDASFSSFTFPSVRAVALQADGRVLVGGGFGTTTSPGYLYRLVESGAGDSTFSPITVNQGIIHSISPQPNGKIYVGGNFTGINGFAGAGIARINADGTLDVSFNTNSAGANQAVYDVEVGTDGKILIGGAFSAYNGATQRKIARLNPDGSRDASFNTSVFFDTDTVYDVLPLADGKIIAVGYFQLQNTNKILRFNTDGTFDSTFADLRVGRNGAVYDILPQAGGKIIIGGNFAAVNGVPRNLIARLNADGSLDTGFIANVQGNQGDARNAVNAIVQQADGKILIGGFFFTVGGQQRFSFARLFPDGVPDFAFNSNVGNTLISDVKSIAIQQDGKILVGSFGLSRFNADGTRDASFAPTFTIPTFGGFIYRTVVQPDGKILVAGDFTAVNGTIRGRIARLNLDGTLDTSFNPPGGANNSVYDFALQPDGRIVIGGLFSAVNGANQAYLARLNGNGTLDTSFAPLPDYVVRALALQPDGKIVIGGYFANVAGQPRTRLARVNSNGSLDTTFNSGAGADEAVFRIVLQPDGKISAGGIFTHVNNLSRVGIVRLLNQTVICACIRTPFDFDGDGKADLSVFRPSNSFWYRLNSLNGQFVQQQFGTSTDLIAPSDYDGDGKTDLAYFRPAAPDLAAFYILDSSTNTQRQIIFAEAGDLPVVGDWDGDGKADVAVYREGIGGAQSYFFYRPSGTPGVNFVSIPWGITGDKPVVGDFDGDGKTDAAVFRPSSGAWFVRYSSTGQFFAVQWGANGDLPTPADYDGDGKTDVSVFRPSNGGWYRINSANNSFVGGQFGIAEDIPVAADYDGDGRVDLAVFRPSTGTWYLLRSQQGFSAVQFGSSGDRPAPAAFVR